MPGMEMRDGGGFSLIPGRHPEGARPTLVEEGRVDVETV